MKIITREEWKSAKNKTPFVKHYPKKITIHHQGAGAGDEKKSVIKLFKGAETIRGIQKLHQIVRGFVDIGYHALIAPNGDIYQGRPFDVVGAHVKNNNTGNIGIMLVGNMEVDKPTSEQLQSLKELIIHLTTVFPQLNVPKCIFGHKDFQPTDCPGKNLYPIIFEIKTGKINLFEKD